jgi:hypothetical protein
LASIEVFAHAAPFDAIADFTTDCSFISSKKAPLISALSFGRCRLSPIEQRRASSNERMPRTWRIYNVVEHGKTERFRVMFVRQIVDAIGDTQTFGNVYASHVFDGEHV